MIRKMSIKMIRVERVTSLTLTTVRREMRQNSELTVRSVFSCFIGPSFSSLLQSSALGCDARLSQWLMASQGVRCLQLLRIGEQREKKRHGDEEL